MNRANFHVFTFRSSELSRAHSDRRARAQPFHRRKGWRFRSRTIDTLARGDLPGRPTVENVRPLTRGDTREDNGEKEAAFDPTV